MIKVYFYGTINANKESLFLRMYGTTSFFSIIFCVVIYLYTVYEMMLKVNFYFKCEKG